MFVFDFSIIQIEIILKQIILNTIGMNKHLILYFCDQVHEVNNRNIIHFLTFHLKFIYVLNWTEFGFE